MTGSPINEGPIVRLPLPLLAMGRRPRPHPGYPRSVAVSGRLLPALNEGGRLQEKDLVGGIQELREKEGANKVMHYTFLACWAKRHCLSSSHRHSASAATCSGVTSPVSKTVNLALACQHQAYGRLALGRLSTPGVILKDQEAGCDEKESLAKIFNLGSQFKGSLLLNLLLLLSGPLTDLIASAINLGMGRGLSSSRIGRSSSPRPWALRNDSSRLGTCSQPDSRHKKRKSYFQYLTFDFFSLAIMKPGLLLKQYHPRSPVYLGAF
ncbi:hypothetical protein Cgig2_022558 [Carnegiea gigantea]|uniref:Uncharacterized protein n=1 Tax=Carnegiea gigantea TaxID=171969 RepID=A0A9Q1KLN3_9CARY|nr:hypothetical protein Cgig2_022558 [Carnegiea gigantea]